MRRDWWLVLAGIGQALTCRTCLTPLAVLDTPAIGLGPGRAIWTSFHSRCSWASFCSACIATTHTEKHEMRLNAIGALRWPLYILNGPSTGTRKRRASSGQGARVERRLGMSAHDC